MAGKCYRTVIKEPHAIVITEKLAKKIFGKEDPLNKGSGSDNSRDVTVTGW